MKKRRPPRLVYDQTSLGPGDFQVIELLAYEALGLCGERQAGDLIDAGATTYRGKHNVVLGGAAVVTAYPRAEH